MEKTDYENKAFKPEKKQSTAKKEKLDPFKYARKQNITLNQAKRELGIDQF